MRLMSTATKPETRMPTMEDLHRLAKDTNERVDRMEAKLDSLHDEMRLAVRTLLESFSGQ